LRSSLPYVGGGKALVLEKQFALRGRRQGAAAPPAPPAQGFAPGNPKLMPWHN
jgi:hypothetical protein